MKLIVHLQPEMSISVDRVVFSHLWSAGNADVIWKLEVLQKISRVCFQTAGEVIQTEKNQHNKGQFVCAIFLMKSVDRQAVGKGRPSFKK